MRHRKATIHVVLSDIHIPYHDPSAVNIAFAVCRDVQPSTIHLLGDIIDCYPVTTHYRRAEKRLTLKEEVWATLDFLKRLRRHHPKARIIFYEGNHEARLVKFLNRQAPEVLDMVDLPRDLQLHELRIETRDRTQHGWIGPLALVHGTTCSKHGSYAAKNALERYCTSFIQGHTEKIGLHMRRTLTGSTLVGYENGCLRDLGLNPATEFMVDHIPWQQGFSVVFHHPDCPLLPEVRQVHIQNGLASFGGKLYNGRLHNRNKTAPAPDRAHDRRAVGRNHVAAHRPARRTPRRVTPATPRHQKTGRTRRTLAA